MSKEDVINYVMTTPGNPNRAVLEGMLDSISDGGIEIITLFDDDIIATNYSPGTQYGPAYSNGFGNFSNSAAEDGLIKITYENKNGFGVYTKSSNEAGFELTVNINGMESPLSGFTLGDYSSLNSFYFTIYGVKDKDADLEAYCQEPHHLKVEWFTV